MILSVVQAAGDSTSVVHGDLARWEEPARAYAAVLLTFHEADEAVREVLAELGARETDDVTTALDVVRTTVAARVPRSVPPAPTGLRRLAGRRRLPMLCSQMPELLAARAASRLTPGDVARLAVHLDNCRVCSEVDERVGTAERAFDAAKPPAVAAVPADEPAAPPVQPATWAGAGGAAAPTGDAASTWIPESVGGAGQHDITVTRASDGATAPAKASDWLVEPPVASAHAPTVATADDWLAASAALTSTVAPGEAPVYRAQPSPKRKGRLRLLVPVAMLATIAAAGLAVGGVFDGDEGRPTVSATTDSQRAGDDVRTVDERARDAATRRRGAERRRAERRRAAARRRAAERRRVAARRRAAAPAPPSAPPASAPAPSGGSPAPAPRAPQPPAPRPTTPRPTSTTPAKTRPPDTPKPSAPSSQPGRQAPPTG